MVYFLQEKSEAFVAFKNYKAPVEKEVGSPIKVLRTDRGEEYNSHEFANFLQDPWNQKATYGNIHTSTKWSLREETSQYFEYE